VWENSLEGQLAMLIGEIHMEHMDELTQVQDEVGNIFNAISQQRQQ